MVSRGSSWGEAPDTLVIKKKNSYPVLHVGNAIKLNLSLLICTTEVGDCLTNILVVTVLNAFSWSWEIFIFCGILDIL
jgi:hypothetical protein